MAVLHGVRVESVNHPAASWQMVRMRTYVTKTMPGILDLLARHRDGQPLGSLTVGDLIGRFYTPGWAVHGLPFVRGREASPQGLAPFEEMDPDERAMLARALRAQLGRRSLRPADRASIEQVAAYLERLRRVEKFQLQDWKPSPRGVHAAEGLQRVLWALENDLMAGAYVVVTRNDWDTHFLNTARQERASGMFVPLFARFLDELSRRRNQHGTLLDRTTIVVTGELGRYPRLNSDRGKDHFPEVSMLFMGAGIASGKRGLTLGRTGRDMFGLPMDHATGRIGGKAHVRLDDVGTTLLHLFGIAPAQYGYGGRVIRPLLAS
ncbi:MAG TPA: DUF1501 domain-containing protein [Kofleriaceae bacterium]|nr:DUF1501 domain-containing protein [Kofleriaceae bacterium]